MADSKKTLKRTGYAPLRFSGELIAEASTRSHDGPGQNRWHELGLWRTAGGGYVAGCVYRTQWQGERDHYWAAATDRPENVPLLLAEIAAELETPVAGYPAGEAYAERQTRMLADLRGRFDAAVSDLLTADPRFAETVD